MTTTNCSLHPLFKGRGRSWKQAMGVFMCLTGMGPWIEYGWVMDTCMSRVVMVVFEGPWYTLMYVWSVCGRKWVPKLAYVRSLCGRNRESVKFGRRSDPFWVHNWPVGMPSMPKNHWDILYRLLNFDKGEKDHLEPPYPRKTDRYPSPMIWDKPWLYLIYQSWKIVNFFQNINSRPPSSHRVSYTFTKTSYVILILQMYSSSVCQCIFASPLSVSIQSLLSFADIF
jgi:hypothetical protein